MATRKYVNNRVEVVDSQEQSFITPRMIFGYSKTDNFAQVYNEDNLVLTPVGTEKTTGFESGDRALYNVGMGYGGEIPLRVSIGGTYYAIKNPDGTDVISMERGWHAMYYNGTDFVLDDFDLDEKDYVYCDNIINGCIAAAEKYMGYDIIPKQYREFRNDLTGDYYETDRLFNTNGAIFNLRRGATFQGLEISYTKTDGTIATVPDSEWYLAGDKLVVTKDYYQTADKLECVAIKYNVSNDIEPDLYAALLQHISEAYEGRGICTSTSCPAALGMSSGVMAVYNTYKKPRIGA